jgi:Tol biopolymer transport system component
MKQRLIPIVLVFATACTDRGAMTPTEPPQVPVFTVTECDLGMPDGDILTAIDALIAEIDALEAGGTLGHGRAQALRNHLLNARDQLLAGRRCPAEAQLRAFRGQVTSFVGDGALTPAEAAPLLDGVGQLLEDVIAFATRRDGNYEIYTMNLDGSGLTRLTVNTRVDASPDWSPDGTKIVFESTREAIVNEDGVINNRGVYVMDADGNGVTRLFFDENDDEVIATHPRWSPDGTRILFSIGTVFIGWTLHVINSDGTALTALTPSPSDHIRVEVGDWSPNGNMITFSRFTVNENQVYSMNADGSGLTQLTTEGHNRGPAWSPYGDRIAFTSHRDGNSEIYVMHADGTNQVRLTSNSENDESPRWSPDGRRIIFVSGRDGNSEIYVMNADGGGQTRLTDHAAIDIEPAWR